MKPPLSKVELILKQINLDELHDIGLLAMQSAFGGFINMTMSEEEKSHRRKEITDFFGGEKVLPGSQIVTDRASFRRRFAGDKTLFRGSYYSIARDQEGHDGATLLHELLAYYEPTEPGWVGVFDLSIPEQRDAVLSRMASEPKVQLSKFDLNGPNIVIAFLPVNGRPHHFAARYTDKAIPFFVTIPTIIKKMRVDRVVDLRSPQVAAWFTKEMTRWRVVLDGKELDFIPGKQPLRKFQDLIPTLLEQSRGSESRALSTSAAIRLRNLGTNGLVFPSARADSFVKVHGGQVIESIGWNFVDYRGSGTPEVSYVVDMDTGWPTEVGWRQMVYEDVNIQFAEHGASKGSWSVSGLASWQEAWFRVQAVYSVLEAKDRKLFDEVNPHLSTLWRLAKSGEWLLQVSDIIFGALLAVDKDLNTVQKWAQDFQGSGQEELAASLRMIVASASH